MEDPVVGPAVQGKSPEVAGESGFKQQTLDPGPKPRLIFFGFLTLG